MPVTVIKAGPCLVVQKKTPETDGYAAVQVEIRGNHQGVPGEQTHDGWPFKKAEVGPRAKLKEFRLATDEVEQYAPGSEIPLDIFQPGDFVDVTGISIGKGYAGVVKRHKFHGAPGGHGTHEFFRHGGSIGQNTTPGRVLKGKKMAGQMGNKKVTVQSLKVVEVRENTNLVIIEGAVPGPKNGYIIIKKAVKRA